jgi:hypothetical protein
MNTKNLTSVAAIGLLLIAFQPASAQYGYGNGRPGRHGHGYNNQNEVAVATAINTRIVNLQAQLSTMASTRQLRRHQQNDLSRSLSQVISMRNRALRDGGISAREAVRINTALDNVTSQIQLATTASADQGRGRGDWNNWNWDEQRNHLRSSWRERRANLAAAQQAELDAQMKAQWMQYHHNKWNGQYTWDQYSDPNFLDYLHTNNPSLLSTVRSALGF